MTILSELKRLYAKITGATATGTTTDEVIAELADNFPVLPGSVSVTAELDDGVKLATISAGGEDTDIYTYTPAVTAADITEIVTSLKALYIAKGGTAEAAAEFTTIADVIDGITALIE